MSIPLETLTVEELRERIAALKASRPSNLDIPAVTDHARAVDRLQGHLDAKLNLQAQAWRPVPIRNGKPVSTHRGR